jgi:hypothetical protein
MATLEWNGFSAYTEDEGEQLYRRGTSYGGELPHAVLARITHESSRRTVTDNAGCPAFPTCKLSVSCPTLYVEAGIWTNPIV